MSFRGPSYRRPDLHLLHAQALSRHNDWLPPRRTLGAERRYSTEAPRRQRTPGISAFAASFFFFFRDSARKAEVRERERRHRESTHGRLIHRDYLASLRSRLNGGYSYLISSFSTIPTLEEEGATRFSIATSIYNPQSEFCFIGSLICALALTLFFFAATQ